MVDPIADMLTRIRNANLARKREVSVPYSNLKLSIANILKREGFIHDIHIPEDRREKEQMKIVLKYSGNEPVLRTVKRISKPGNRVYQSYRTLPRIVGAYGVAILSTSRGVMTHTEARKRKLGGEILCEIY